MRTLRSVRLILALATTAGCAATTPPPIDAAEPSFAKNGVSRETVGLAYVANRRARSAEAQGDALQTAQQLQQALANMHDAETPRVKATFSQLGRANAQAELAAFASMKQEQCGEATFLGSVLFASNRSDLIAAAQAMLDQVSSALAKQDVESKITVEGHTDSRGDASYNQDLSQRRAQSVRDYLVLRGIASDRVAAHGFGLTRPIADNASVEGRANNRRVEIAMQPRSPSLLPVGESSRSLSIGAPPWR